MDWTDRTIGRHATWLRRLAGDLVRDAGVADDITQETLLAALAHPRAQTTRAWLATVLRNAARQWARSERARGQREQRCSRGEETASTLTSLESLERSRRLLAAVRDLPTNQREAVHARYYLGETSAQTARRLGRPDATVRQWTKRGLARLRRELDERAEAEGLDLRAFLVPLLLRPPAAPRASGWPAGRGAWLAAGTLAGAALGVGLWSLAARDDVSGSAETLAPAEPTTLDAARDALGEPARRSVAETDSGPWVLRGRVAMASPGSDGEARVLAFAEPLEHGEWTRWLVAEEAPAASRPGPEPLAWAPVAADGTFRLELPPGRPAFLSLADPLAHLPRSLEVRASDPVGSAVLRPELGAQLRVIVPASVPGTLRLHLETLDDDQPLSPRESWLAQDLERPWAGAELGFAAVPTHGRYLVSLRRGGHLLAHAVVDGLHAGKSHRVRLMPSVGDERIGWVRDPRGQPVSGARVEALLDDPRLGLERCVVAETRSDERGRFRFTELPAAALRLRAHAEGHFRSREVPVPVAGSGAGEALLTLRAGREVTGVVRDPRGRALAGVTVRVERDAEALLGPERFSGLSPESQSTQTGDDGGFRLAGLATGPYRVHARVERDGLGWHADVGSVVPGSHLTLHLAAPASLRVTVPGGTEFPAGDLWLQRSTPGLVGPLALGAPLRASAGTDGAWHFERLEPGRWWCRARWPGWASSVPLSVDLVGGQGASLELALGRGVTLRGRVVSPDGEGVAGAWVAAVPADGEGFHGSQVQHALGGLSAERGTHADGGGWFVLRDLVAGEHRLLARGPGFASSATVTRTVTRTAEPELLTLRLDEGVTLHGTVHRARGPRGEWLPTPGAAVHWRVEFHRRTPGALDMRRTESDARGNFRLPALPPGTWAAVAFDPRADLSFTDMAEFGQLHGAGLVYRTLQVPVDGGHVELGELEPHTARLRGRLLCEGRAVPARMLSVVPADADAAARGRAPVIATTDAQGAFDVTLPTPGAQRVTLDLGGRFGRMDLIEYRVDVGAGPVDAEPLGSEPRTLQLCLPASRVEGLVLTTDGEPAVQARVRLEPHGVPAVRRRVEGTTDAVGRFRIEHVPAGAYHLIVGGAPLMRPGARPSGDALHGQSIRLLTVPAGTAHLVEEVRLPAPMGLLLRAPGGPDAVWVVAEGRDGGSAVRTATVLPAGAPWLFGGLAAGEYQLLAVAGTRVARGRATAHPDPRRPLDLELSPGRFLALEPGWGDLSIVAQDGQDLAPSLRTLRELVPGTLPEGANWGPLPSGTYRLEALRAGERWGARVVLDGDGDGVQEVRLERLQE